MLSSPDSAFYSRLLCSALRTICWLEIEITRLLNTRSTSKFMGYAIPHIFLVQIFSMPIWVNLRVDTSAVWDWFKSTAFQSLADPATTTTGKLFFPANRDASWFFFFFNKRRQICSLSIISLLQWDSLGTIGGEIIPSKEAFIYLEFTVYEYIIQRFFLSPIVRESMYCILHWGTKLAIQSFINY